MLGMLQFRCYKSAESIKSENWEGEIGEMIQVVETWKTSSAQSTSSSGMPRVGTVEFNIRFFLSPLIVPSNHSVADNVCTRSFFGGLWPLLRVSVVSFLSGLIVDS